MEKPIKELLNFSILIIDKPSGPTSFQISHYIKKSLNLSKTSHGGTLDPQVSGVLPIFLGRACRLMDYFLKKDKTYIGIMRLHKEISQEELKKQMKSFEGKIIQTPPVKSRVARKPREREVKKFEILEIDGKDILFEAEVQAGTYIRKLCDDLGKQIGGAHMLELRRTKASIFSEEDKNFINLYDFDKAVEEYKNDNPEKLKKILIPAEQAIKKILPTAQANPSSLKQLLTGKPLYKQDIKNLPEEKTFAIFSSDVFIGIYKKTNEGDIIARPEFVFN